MQQDRGTLTPFYAGWERYNGLLTEAIAPLSPDQLALRADASLRPVWFLAAHIVGARVGWFHGVMGEGGPAIATFGPWDEDDAPRTTRPRRCREPLNEREGEHDRRQRPPRHARQREMHHRQELVA